VSKGTSLYQSVAESPSDRAPADDRAPPTEKISPSVADQLLQNTWETLDVEKSFEPFDKETNDRLQLFSVFCNKLVMSSKAIAAEYRSDAYKKQIAATGNAVVKYDPSHD
jgi:hypothetical protein